MFNRQNKEVRVFVRTLINAVIALAIGLLTDSQYAVLLIPVLNQATKYINTTYFGDLGVIDER